MRRRALFLVLPALVASALGARAATPASAPADAARLVRQVQERYDDTRNFSADFRQEIHVASGGQVLRSSGKVYFEKPGRMRWEYGAPDPQTIVADGETLWILQPEDNQVLKAPLREAFQSQTPVSFLFGWARIEDGFRVGALGRAADGSRRLELTPTAGPEAGLSRLVLDVDPVTSDIRAATIRDPLGNTTRVELSEMRRNQSLDEGLFRFERPAGADVIEAPVR